METNIVSDIENIEQQIKEKELERDMKQAEAIIAASNRNSVVGIQKKIKELSEEITILFQKQQKLEKSEQKLSDEFLRKQKHLEELTLSIRGVDYKRAIVSLGNKKVVSFEEVFEKFKNILQLQEVLLFSSENGVITFIPRKIECLIEYRKTKYSSHGFTLVGPSDAKDVSDFFKKSRVTYSEAEQPDPEWLGQQLEEVRYSPRDILDGIFRSYAKLFEEFR